MLLLKASKSQKHFFLKLGCPKNERNIRQNSALEFKKWLNKTILIGPLFRFQGNGISRQNAFEIYWPLISPNLLKVLTSIWFVKLKLTCSIWWESLSEWKLVIKVVISSFNLAFWSRNFSFSWFSWFRSFSRLWNEKKKTR